MPEKNCSNCSNLTANTHRFKTDRTGKLYCPECGEYVSSFASKGAKEEVKAAIDAAIAQKVTHCAVCGQRKPVVGTKIFGNKIICADCAGTDCN